MRKLAVIACFIAYESSAYANDYEQNLKSLDDAVSTNPLSANGNWLEMHNVAGEWEKMALIFGYADPGDEAACESILSFAADQNPGRQYRCHPVVPN